VRLIRKMTTTMTRRKMSKIYVYTKDVQTAKKAFFLAFSDVSPDLEPEGFIIIRDIKGYAGKKHPDNDLVFATDQQVLKKLERATLIDVSGDMKTDEKLKALETIKLNISEFLSKNKRADISILDVNIGSLPDILDRDKIAAFIETYKRSYKKPIVITNNSGDVIGIFDSVKDFEGHENTYDVLMTVDEYIAIMLSVLGFNAKTIKFERRKEDDEAS